PDRALLRVETEQPGRVGRDQLDEARGLHAALMHRAVEQHRDTVLDARAAVRDLVEALALALALGELQPVGLLLVAERAVIGRHDRQIAPPQAPPDRLPVR